MNIDINFGITEIQVSNIDINFGITENQVMNMDINLAISEILILKIPSVKEKLRASSKYLRI